MKKELKLIQKIAVSLFLMILLLPMIFINRKTGQVSEIDNRNLTEFPETLLTSEGRAQLDSYLDDRIGFRNEMITADTRINDKLFYVMTHPTYTYGKEGYVFLKIPYEWNINYGYIETYCEMVNTIRWYCEERGITFRYWLNPSKMRIYDQYMPEGVTMDWGDSNYLMDRMEVLTVPYTWTGDVLKEKSETVQVYDKQYDAGHWNDTGAFYGVQKVIDDLIGQGVEIEPLKEELFRKETIELTTLPESYFPIEDVTEKWSFKEQEARLDESYNEKVEVSPEHPGFKRYINSRKENAPSCLLFHGSYMENREWFLADEFSELTSVEAYGNIGNFKYYIDLFQPDVVIFECAEYVLNEGMYPYDVLYQAIGQ